MTLVGGALLVPAWCVLAVFTMHLDDVMALGLTVVAIHQLLRRCWWAAALALGVAAAAKPWAVAFVPLILMVPRVRRAYALLLTVGAAAVWWLPFVLAAPDTVPESGTVQLDTSPDSTLHLIGLHASASDARLTQLGLMVLVGWLAVRRGRWPAIIVAPIAMRMLIDPQTWIYYTSGLVLGAFVWDLLGTRARWPRLTVLTTALLLVESRISINSVGAPQHHGQTFLALLRIVVLLGVLAIVLWVDRPAASALWPAQAERAVQAEKAEEAGLAVTQSTEGAPVSAPAPSVVALILDRGAGEPATSGSS